MTQALKRKIQLIVPAVLICALMSGIFLPIYSDEVVTKFKIARFFLEEGMMVSFFPQCTTTVGHAVAGVFYPAAILISSIYAYLGPLGLRISGIVLALVWFSLLAYWCSRQSKDSWSERFTLLTAFASLGVLPYLWVLSRPEQFMYLPILIFCIAAAYPPVNAGRWLQIGVATGLALLASVFFYAHSKTIFFAPFFFVAAWVSTRHFSILPRVALVIYVIVLSVQSLRNASLLGGCTDAPAIQAMLNANSLMPTLLLSDPYTFISVAKDNIILFPQRLLSHLTFSPTFQSGWLPPLEHEFPLLKWLNPFIYYTILTLVAGSHLFALGLATKLLALRKISNTTLLAALLAAADSVNVALFKIQNFYAGIQYIPISMLILMLLLPRTLENPKHTSMKTTLNIVSIFTTALSLASLFTIFYLITPTLIKNSNYAQATISGQPLSIPTIGANKHIESIQTLGKMCHIPKSNAKNLVVDHMTYFYYLKNKNPIHVLYISELGYGGDLTDGKLLPFLKTKNSPGIIARCEWIPKDFGEKVQKNERGYCCINLESQQLR